MSYIWQRWLADEFRAAGLTVVEVAGWKNRGRPASTGSFDPDEGVTNHHTASTVSDTNTHPTLNLLIQGRSDLPGPLCQWSVGYDGTVYVVAAGRANHAGRTDKSLPGVPAGSDGNAHFMGDEIESNGTQAMPPAQRHAVAVTNRVYLDHFKRDIERVHRHQDLTVRKWDLGSLTTAQLRADAQSVSTTNDWFDMADKTDLAKVVADETPNIVKAILAAKIKNNDPDGSSRTVTLGGTITNLEADQDRMFKRLGDVEKKIDDLLAALVASGK